jgi:hypothetical protein
MVSLERTKGRRKFWLSVAGTIVLGALGSGLWSLLEVPLWKVGNWLLSITTLGIASIRDDIYAKAALGLHELPSLYLLLFVCALMLALPVALPLTATLRSSLHKIVGKGDPDTTREETLGRIRKLLLTTTLVGTLLGSYFVVKFMMVNQENLIASYFRQYVTIIRPYISESEYIRFKSAFSRMQSKREYDHLMSEMRAVAKEKGIELPETHTW